MSSGRPSLQVEPRWPVALTILLMMGLLQVLPNRLHLLPVWTTQGMGLVILLVILAVPLMPESIHGRWLERQVTLVFCGVIGIAMIVGLFRLIEEMITGAQAIDGLYLLASSVVLWVTNVLVFTLTYWHLDRGGPEARLFAHRRPDWLFTEPPDAADTVPPWRPTYVDYLFLAFTTATAFSPTDTLPITARAKLMMMGESTIALVTVAAVASRAINILGS